MELTYSEFLKTPFGTGCISNNINTKDVYDLCCTIGTSQLFENIDTALLRLKESLPYSTKFYKCDVTEKIPNWIKLIKNIEPHFDKSWFKGLNTSTKPINANFQSHLGKDVKRFPLYGALITEKGSEHEEITRSKILGQILAYSFLRKNSEINSNLSNRSYDYVLNSIRKAGDKNSIWYSLIENLTQFELKNSRDYLEHQILTCQKLKIESRFSMANCEFLSYMITIAQALLPYSAFQNKIKNFNISEPPEPTLLYIRLPDNINFDITALDENDIDEPVEIVSSFPTDASKIPLSDAGQQTIIKTSQYSTELNNQLLPWRWNTENPTEILYLSNYLKLSNTKNLEDNYKINFLIAFTMATGQCLESIMSFMVFKDIGSPLQEYENIIITEEMLWVHSIPKLNNSFSPESRQLDALYNIGSTVWLPLPKIICEWVKYFFSDQNINDSLQNLLKISIEQIKPKINATFSEIKSDRTMRSSLSRCEKVLFDKVLKVAGGDEIAALTILGNSLHRPPAGLYYTSFEMEYLQELYKNATQLIFNEDL